MIDTYVQIAIAVPAVAGLIAMTQNRIFIGCLLAFMSLPLWVASAVTAEQWGVVIVLVIKGSIYFLGVVTRWPRKPPPKDEHETNLGV